MARFVVSDLIITDGVVSTSIAVSSGLALSGFSAVSTNGFIARIGSNTYTARTITGTAGQITVTNGDGVSGAPTISLPSTITQATTFSSALIVAPDITINGTGSAVVNVNSTASAGAALVFKNSGTPFGYFGASKYAISNSHGLNSIGLTTAGAENLYFGTNGTTRLTIHGTTGAASFSSVEASTSTTTGSLINAGGFGNAGKAFFGNTINATLSSAAEFNGITVTNPNGGTTTESSIYVGNGGTGATSAAIGGTGTSYTAVGGFLQNAGYLSSGTSMSGGLSIMSRAATSAVRIYAGSHTNLVATFGSTGQVSIASTTEATTGGAGSLTTGGGIYAAKKAIAALFQTPAYTVATLPTASASPGAIAYVTDSNATTRYATVAGGGSSKVIVFSDGTNWLIL